MGNVKWPGFAGPWLWLCPTVAVLIATAVLRAVGFAWWSALLAAVLLACPVLILWGAVDDALDERRRRAARRPEPDESRE